MAQRITPEDKHRLALEACPTMKKPYLFEIAKDRHVSHIFGTRHLGVSLARVPSSVRELLANASLVVLEVAPGDHGSSSGSADPPPARHRLHDVLGPEGWRHYVDLVGPTQAKFYDEESTPAEALVELWMTYEDPTMMLDQEIKRAARDAKIPIAGLESSDVQQRVVDHIGDEAVRSEIENIKDRAELRRRVVDDIASYCAGDAMELDPSDDHHDLFARNRAWIPRLEPMLAKGNAFIVVGSNHLLSDRGVPALLRARGYSVTRVAP